MMTALFVRLVLSVSLFPTIPTSLVNFLHHHLYQALPPVPDETPEQQAERQLVFMSGVVRLAPMNTGEALLAVHAIAAEAHAMDAMKALHRAAGDPTRERQYRSQSCSMMRQAAQARRELLRMQAIRHEAEAWHDAQAAEATPPADAAEETQVESQKPRQSPRIHFFETKPASTPPNQPGLAAKARRDGVAPPQTTLRDAA